MYTPIIKCSLCGEEYTIYHQDRFHINVDPHWCDYMTKSFFERVCTKCDSLIRCRRDGFECKEAVGDWVGGHELYIQGQAGKEIENNEMPIVHMV